MDHLLQLATFRRECNYPGSAVLEVRLSSEVAMVFEVTQQIVDGLPRDLKSVGDIRGALLIKAGVAEQTHVRWVHVVVSSGDNTVVDVFPHRLPSHSQHRAQVRTVLW